MIKLNIVKERNHWEESRINYYGYVETDYSSYTPKDEEHSKITNARPTYVNLVGLAKTTFESIINKKLITNDEKEIMLYGIERIASALEMFDVSKFEVTITGGYYGDEIGGVYIKRDINEKFLKTIEDLIYAENKIEFLLNVEYNNVLPILKDKKWVIKTVSYQDIHVGQVEHLGMIRKSTNPYSKDYNGIIGITLFDGQKYRLYDGTHRYSSQEGKKLVKVFVGE